MGNILLLALTFRRRKVSAIQHFALCTTHRALLTACLAFLVTAVETVVVSVALPQRLDAAPVVALELIAFTPLGF